MAKQGKPRTKRGHVGSKRHIYNEEAAAWIETLSAYGLPLRQIAHFLDTFRSDADDQGYSYDTIQRHYSQAVERGKFPDKNVLLAKLFAMAMGEHVPEGVSPDTAYRIQGDKLEKLLDIQYGVGATNRHVHSVEGIASKDVDFSVLTDDELADLSRIMRKLASTRIDRGRTGPPQESSRAAITAE